MDRAGEPGEGLVRRESEKGETGRSRPFFFDFWSAWWGWIFASPAVDFFRLPGGGHSPAVGGRAALRMGRSPCGERLFYQPAHLCRGGYLIRPAEGLHKSAFSFGEKGTLLCFVGCGLPGWGLFFRLPSRGHSPAVGGRAALRMGRTPCG